MASGYVVNMGSISGTASQTNDQSERAMKMRRIELKLWKRFALSIAAAALALTQVSTGSAESIGVFPTSIDFESLARGTEVFRQVGVLHDSEQTRQFKFEAQGELAPWISFVDLDDRTTPMDILEVPVSGERSRGAVALRLTIPEDAPNGFYEGTVRVSSISLGTTEVGASSVSVAANISLFADISGVQTVGGTLLDASARSVESGFPLRIDFRMRNTGNVQIKPVIHYEVFSGEESLLTGEHSEETIAPADIITITPEIDVSELRVGDYTIATTVDYEGFELGSETLAFSILERGTLTRQGTLRSLAVVNNPIAGEVARVVISFQNTGQIEANAIFQGQLFRNGQLVDVVTSLPQLVLAGAMGEIEVFIPVGEDGEYEIQGKVNFDGKESEPVQLLFNVPITRQDNTIEVNSDTTGAADAARNDVLAPSEDGSNSMVMIIAIAAVAAVAVAGVAFVAIRRRGGKPSLAG